MGDHLRFGILVWARHSKGTKGLIVWASLIMISRGGEKGRLLILQFVLALLGIALVNGPTTAEEKRIEDLKMIAGTYWGRIEGGPVTVYIKEDGSYQAHGRTLRIDGQITLAEGKGRYATSQGRTGTVTLHEDKGKTFLRFVRDDGSLMSDLERAK